MKKIFITLLLIAVTLTLSGCTETKVPEENVLLRVKQELVLEDEYTQGNLPTLVDGVTITWTSSSLGLLDDSFAIVQANEDQTTSFTAALTLDGVTLIKIFNNVLVKGHYTDEEITVVYDGYYLGADGLTGAFLKAFLHELIDDHTVLSYDDVKYALRDTDEDPNNSDNVILFYSGRSQSKLTFGGGTSDYNREHVWAKSHGDFGNLNGPGSDLHHLRPTDVTVNSTRGNLDFDMGGEFVDDYTGALITSKKDGDSFEPRDEVKGDVARILFYMVVRYEGLDPQFSVNVDLELNEEVDNRSAAFMGRLSVLLQWHIDDPVDEFEMNRNDVIFGYQGNRNPFIDNPEFVEMIWGTPVS